MYQVIFTTNRASIQLHSVNTGNPVASSDGGQKLYSQQLRYFQFWKQLYKVGLDELAQ
jgi:hypothetical protein